MREILLRREKIILLGFLLFSVQVLWAQSRQISGKVIDEEGTGLPGVNVLIKGTTQGTVTDLDGNYQINVPSAESVLVFSSVGFIQEEILAGGQSTINVTMMPDIKTLGEVVVVGYGKQARELVSSSVTKVDTEIIQSTPSIDPVQSLEGRVAGLSIQVNSGQPGGVSGNSTSIYLRGGTSPDPNSGDAPLFLIDGVIRSDLGGLNPEDIESLQVLKDAAATSIYGARAANGIILVTTKKGSASKKALVSVNYDFGIEDLRKTYPWTSAEEYIAVSRMAAQRGGNLTPGSRLDGEIFGYSAQQINERGQYGYLRNTLTYLDDLIAVEGQAYVADLLENQGFQTMKDPATGRTLIFKDNNYNDVTFQTAYSHDLDIGISGGNESGNYYLNLGYVDQEGIYIGTEGSNFNFLANGEYKVYGNLRVDAGASFQKDSWTSVSSPRDELNRSPKLPHTYRLFNDDGTPALGESTSSPRNRFHELYYEDKNRDILRMTYRFGADWQVVDGLSFRPSASFYREEFIYNSFEKASPEIPDRDMRREQMNDNQFMANGILNYVHSFNKHNVDLMGGVNYTFESYDELIGSGSNAPTDLISTINASETEQERASSEIYDTKLFSYFGRVDYNFDARYLLNASFRVDGSSSFAKNRKWGFFPAFSAGWNVHEEDFWQSTLLSRLKIRGSWGQAGSLSNLNLSDTQGQFQTVIYNGQGGVVNSTLPNYDLTWETTTTTDIGFDIGLLKNRINLYVDLYDKLTSDRIISKNLPGQSGFGSIKDNHGSLQNRGIEVELSANVLNIDDFSWNTSFTFAFNRSTIKELPENDRDKNRIDGGVIYSPTADDPDAEIEVGGLAEGERIGGIWAFDLVGVYADDEAAQNGAVDMFKANTPQGGDAIWRDVNGDNVIDEKDLVFVGWQTPEKRGGMVNTLSWKGFSLRFTFDFALGHVIANGPLARSLSNARNNVMTMTNVLGEDVWKAQGDQGKTVPRYDIYSDWDSGARNHLRSLGSNGNLGVGDSPQNTLYYRKGDFLAFREVSLSYNIPEKLLSRLGLTQASLGIGAYNLGYLTEYDGLSPEIYDGADEGVYPRPRKFLTRLKITF